MIPSYLQSVPLLVGLPIKEKRSKGIMFMSFCVKIQAGSEEDSSTSYNKLHLGAMANLV